MRIGYPCVNLSLPCRASRTFRLASLEEKRLYATVEGNLRCLAEMVRWNAARGLLFLRITSDLVPLASHPENRFPWDRVLRPAFAEVGGIIRRLGVRVGMHPGQYTLLNSPRREVVEAARAELRYHARVLELLGADGTAKVQIHIGGAYGDKEEALRRFVRAVGDLEPEVQARLVVENDERLYTLSDALHVHEFTGAPVVFDIYHHALHPDGHNLREALALQATTWTASDGLPIVDYSSPHRDGRRGSHAHALDEDHFLRFLEESRPHDFDLMLEVKDKERSALRALALVDGDSRLVREAP